MASNMNSTAPQTDAPRRGRGRPKIAISERIERDLLETGMARAGFGGAQGTPEITARMRLYNAAKRLGLRVTTEKVTNKGRYFQARVVNQ